MPKTATAITTILVLLSLACDSKKEASAEGAAATKASAQANDGEDKGPAIDYGPVDAQIKAAKTGEEWTKALMACSQLEIDAALNGQPKLADDPEYNKHCGVTFEMTRAKQAVELSTPDKMHASCISASMGMEGLIEKGKAVEEAKSMLAKVKQACGL